MPLAPDPDNPHADEDFVDALQDAALVLLHREIEAHGLVSLSQRDFEEYQHIIDNPSIKLSMTADEVSGDILIAEIGPKPN